MIWDAISLTWRHCNGLFWFRTVPKVLFFSHHNGIFWFRTVPKVLLYHSWSLLNSGRGTTWLGNVQGPRDKLYSQGTNVGLLKSQQRSHTRLNMAINHLSIPILQRRLYRWTLEWINSFIPHFIKHVMTYSCWDFPMSIPTPWWDPETRWRDQRNTRTPGNRHHKLSWDLYR